MSLFVQTVASRENARFKALQKQIAQPRLLRKAGLAVAEGLHLLQELPQWPGIRIREIWFASVLRLHREWDACENLLQTLGVDCIEVPAELYARLSELEQGAGPLVLFETPVSNRVNPAVVTSQLEPWVEAVRTGDASPASLVVPAPPSHDIVLLDGVQDPGNVGTLIRTAAAVGIREIWTTPDCAWVWSGKVLRSAMGGHRHVDLPGLPDQALHWVSHWARTGVPIRLMRLEESQSLFQVDLRQPGLWLLGSEGQGVSSQWAELATQALRIPMRSGVESLNVAAAAAVCLYEQVRQRGQITELAPVPVRRSGG